MAIQTVTTYILKELSNKATAAVPALLQSKAEINSVTCEELFPPQPKNNISFSSFLLSSRLLSVLQAVRLESAYPLVTRYMVVVSTNGRQDTEESIVLGMDFVSSDRSVRRRHCTTLSCSCTPPPVNNINLCNLGFNVSSLKQ